MDRWKSILAAGLVTVFFVGLAAPVQAASRRSATSSNVIPLGFQIFCLKTPSACRGGGESTVAMSEGLMTALQGVNRQVNRAIRPRHDRAGRDVWTVNPASGDCEDYVLTKRFRLIQAGLPPSALRIATVYTPSGERHAVLVVRTSQGDFVLDNLTSRIKPFDQSGLRLVAISGADPLTWTRGN